MAAGNWGLHLGPRFSLELKSLVVSIRSHIVMGAAQIVARPATSNPAGNQQNTHWTNKWWKTNTKKGHVPTSIKTIILQGPLLSILVSNPTQHDNGNICPVMHARLLHAKLASSLILNTANNQGRNLADKTLSPTNTPRKVIPTRLWLYAGKSSLGQNRLAPFELSSAYNCRWTADRHNKF